MRWKPPCPEGIAGGGWQLVRHVPPGLRWHVATDRLAGTDEYGTRAAVHHGRLSREPWSVQFRDAAELLVASGDCSAHRVLSRDAAIRAIFNSGRIVDARGWVVYQEAGSTNASAVLTQGAQVYVRTRPAVPGERPYVAVDNIRFRGNPAYLPRYARLLADAVCEPTARLLVNCSGTSALSCVIENQTRGDCEQKCDANAACKFYAYVPVVAEEKCEAYSTCLLPSALPGAVTFKKREPNATQPTLLHCAASGAGQ